jgi:hypothetical protein
MFLHWTFECDPDLQGWELIIVLYQWCHNGDHFCQVILKTLQQFKCFGQTQNVDFLTFDLDLV